MAGALMQLVAYGAQDVYLTGNPQITFFKVVYRRHTNFAMESMQQTLIGANQTGGRVVGKISRNGDLLGATYYTANVAYTTTGNAGGATNPNDALVSRFGFALLRNVELRIGGQRIDSQSSTWMNVWTELTHTNEQKRLLDSMVGVGGGAFGTENAVGVVVLAGVAANGNHTFPINVPLQFSFCRNPGLAIPLIALQYHDVEIVVDYEQLANLVNTGSAATLALNNVNLFCDFIFLDTEERKSFAQNPHEYLIETVQEQAATLAANANSVRLDFNHPIKELMWVSRAAIAALTDQFANYNGTAAAAGTPLNNAVIRLNGQDRLSNNVLANNGVALAQCKYYRDYQVNKYHTGSPTVPGIHCYSFAIKPEEHQPSGTCNFSRIDNATLDLTLPAVAVGTRANIMAHGYNVLRIASGMGGLAYSN